MPDAIRTLIIDDSEADDDLPRSLLKKTDHPAGYAVRWEPSADQVRGPRLSSQGSTRTVTGRSRLPGAGRSGSGLALAAVS